MSPPLPRSHEAATPWQELEQSLRTETPDQWAERLHGVSPNAFNMHQIVLARFAKPDQIRRLLDLVQQSSGPDAAGIGRWQQTLQRLTPDIFSSTAQYRRTESHREDHWVDHYTPIRCEQGETAPASPAIVGFSGAAGLLMAPASCVLTALAGSGHDHDLLVIRRKYLTSYFADDAALLISIVQHLQEILQERLASSIVLGTSNGGLAALAVTLALKLPHAIAIGAGVPKGAFESSDPLALTARILDSPLQPALPSSTSVLLAAGMDHPTDRENALLIAEHLNRRYCPTTKATSLLFRGCSGHDLPADLSRQGITLNQFYLPLFHNNPAALSAYTEPSLSS